MALVRASDFYGPRVTNSGLGERVFPNLLAGKSPEKAVTTHPEIVRQVIRLVQGTGAVVTVGDSPGLGKPENVARKCGIYDVVKATGARFASFEESVPVQFGSGTFHQLEVSREAIETDVMINLPKLKTHQMMGYTGAVKNLFGLVVGMRKFKHGRQTAVQLESRYGGELSEAGGRGPLR